MSTVQSRKQKARRLQQEVVRKILELFPEELTERDVRSAPMGTTGEDVVLSEKGTKKFPFAVECKNREKLNIWAALEQAELRDGNLTPLVVFKRNFSEIYCTLKFDDFLKILKK